MNNPWKGLLPYEDINDENLFLFRGRDSSISVIFSVVCGNLLTTLYGKTGIGKTSILKAGLFPILRSQFYLPVYVRLKKEKASDEYAKQIIDEIEKEINKTGGRINVATQTYDGANSPIEKLWKYFCVRSFENKDGHEIFPVIVLDQFEDIFLAGEKEDAAFLLRQVYALLDDNREVPIGEGFSDMSNFRFVISIREDDLYYLEDSIDQYGLYGLKENRYRLSPLTVEEAQEIVMLGRDAMNRGEEDSIANQIINKSKDASGQISTNLLSLICSQSFLQSKGMITLDMFTDDKKNAIDLFYKDCMKHVSETTRKYIETELVKDDRKNFVPRDIFKSHIDDKDYETLTTGQYKIIQDFSAGGVVYMELIHDTLAQSVVRCIKERQEQDKINKTKQHRVMAYCALALAAIIISLFFYFRYQNFKIQMIAESQPDFTITLYEDSLVVADQVYWSCRLMVDKSNDTNFLIDTLINKSTAERTFSLKMDTSDGFSYHIVLLFEDSNRFSKIDTVVKINDLMLNRSVPLWVGYNVKKWTKVTGNVKTKVNGRDRIIQDATIVMKDKARKTDAFGNFSLDFREAVSEDEPLYVVKKGFKVKKVEKALGLDSAIYLEFADSIMKFADKLNHIIYRMDSLGAVLKQKNYSHFRDYFNEDVYDKDGQNIFKIIINIIRGKKNTENQYEVFGYVLIYPKKEIISDNNRSEYAIIVSGWKDGTFFNNSDIQSQTFYLEGDDIVNNHYRISGQRWRSNGASGVIYGASGQKILSFGKDNDADVKR